MTGTKRRSRIDTTISTGSPKVTAASSAWNVNPSGLARVWASALVMNTAIWARVTEPSGEKRLREVPTATPASNIFLIARYSLRVTPSRSSNTSSSGSTLDMSSPPAPTSAASKKASSISAISARSTGVSGPKRPPPPPVIILSSAIWSMARRASSNTPSTSMNP